MKNEWTNEQGVLFEWGESGLQSVDDTRKECKSEEEHPAEVPEIDLKPVDYGFGEFRTLESFAPEIPEDMSEYRVGPSSGDWDACNDPEEYRRESEIRKEARKKKAALKKRPEPGLFARAVDSLARRDYSRKELFQKLCRGLKDGETKTDVEKVLCRLEELGYLSDDRFAKCRVRVRSAGLGNARLRRELRQKGVSEDKVEAAMETIEEPESLRAYRVWSRRYKELPKDRKERDRQIRYLMYRGFSMDSISQVLRGRVEIPEEEDFLRI